MKKNEYCKIFYVIIFSIIFQGLTYILAKLTPFPIHYIGNNIDDKIPLISNFVYFYVLWYLMIIFVPFFLYKRDKDSFKKYICTDVICLLISMFIFILYPTTINRPNIQINNLSSVFLNIIYFFDTPAMNCLPSVHCIISFIFIFCVFKNKKMNFTFRISIEILSILVIISTMFIKQHVLIDAVAAFIISLGVYILVQKLKIYLLINKF